LCSVTVDDKLAIVQSVDTSGLLKLWDLRRQRPLGQYMTSSRGMMMTKHSLHLHSVFPRCSGTLWVVMNQSIKAVDIRCASSESVMLSKNYSDDPIAMCCVAKQTALLFIATVSFVVQVWDLKSGKLQRILNLTPRHDASGPQRLTFLEVDTEEEVL